MSKQDLTQTIKKHFKQSVWEEKECGEEYKNTLKKVNKCELITFKKYPIGNYLYSVQFNMNDDKLTRIFLTSILESEQNSSSNISLELSEVDSEQDELTTAISKLNGIIDKMNYDAEAGRLATAELYQLLSQKYGKEADSEIDESGSISKIKWDSGFTNIELTTIGRMVSVMYEPDKYAIHLNKIPQDANKL